MADLDIACVTDTGGRGGNEDRLVAKSLGAVHLLAVADGLGGHAAGEVASSVALTELEGYLRANVVGEDILHAVKEAVSKANKEIHLLSEENPGYAGMGTTLVMGLVQADKVLVANVGDSRLYHISENAMNQITRDHSVVQELVEQGLITAQDALCHPEKSVLTRVLGLEPEVEADTYDIEFLPDDLLLLCSDGLTDSLRDEEIRGIIVSSGNLDEACARLISLAREKGGTDNISVVLARRKRE
ncbi:MAG: Stp1/IreP family PP2C-type Ser/Thr phosphatase [Dehalococcoidia bacterium]